MSTIQSENMKKLWAKRRLNGTAFFSERHKKNISIALKGGTPGSFSKERLKDKTKHPRWKGGISRMSWYRTIYSRNYKLRKKMTIGKFTSAEWLNLKNYFNCTCVSCKRKEPEIKLEADHVIPLCMNGSNFISNIQPLCRSCNAKKYKSSIDYRLIYAL